MSAGTDTDVHADVHVDTDTDTGTKRAAAAGGQGAQPAAGSVLSTLAVVAPAVGSAVAGGLAFKDAYPLSTLIAVCVFAALPPGLVTVATSRSIARRGHGRGRGPSRGWMPVAISVAAWLVILPPATRILAASGTGSPGWWSGLFQLPDGPYRLLAGSLPVTPTPVLLLLAGTLVWWAAECAVEAAVRGAGPLAVLSAPTLVLAAGTSVTARYDSWASLPAAAGLVGFGVLQLLACNSRGQHGQHGQQDIETAAHRTAEAGAAITAAAAPGPSISVRSALVATLAAVAVAGSSIAVASLLPGLSSRTAADPRRLVHPAAAAPAAIDPLSQVAAWLDAPPRPLFTVRTATPVNTRWLILDQYDGDGWGSSARYAPTGQQVAAQTGAGPTVRTGTTAETITIGALPGSWLPAAPTPLTASGSLLSADPQLGLLATGDGRPAQGTTYTVVSSTPEPTLDQLAVAVPGSGPAVAPDLTVPGGLPPSVAALGRAAMLDAAYPYQQLVQLQDWLRSYLAYDPHAFPAQAYGNLALVVGVTHSAGQDVFATLFAVLARAAGFPARIAVGFGPGRATGADTYQVTTADALVWPEVYLTGLGWTAFYPVPAPRQATASGGVAQAVGEPSQQASLDQGVTADNPGAAGRRPADDPARVKIAAAPGSPWWILAGIAAGAAAVLALAGLVVARSIVPAAIRVRRRRRRRGHPDPRRRTIGAWQDALEAVGRSVGEPLDALTTAEVGERAGRAPRTRAAQERLRRLARLSEIAIFAPDAAHFEVTARDAATAWHEADEIRRLISRSRSRLRSRRTPVE